MACINNICLPQPIGQYVIMGYRHIITLVLVTVLANFTHGRILADKITATKIRKEEGFIFLDRMQLSKGMISFNIKLSLETTNSPAQGAYQMIFAAIPDDTWEDYVTHGCKMSLDGPQVPTRGDRRYTKPVVLDSVTRKAETSMSFVLQKPTGYHFVLTDCKKNLVNEYFNKKSKLLYEIQVSNNNSNVGDDEKSLGWLIPLFLLGTGLCLYALSNKASFSEHNQTDYPKIMLQVALYSRVTALVFYWIFFLIYSLGDGNEYGFFEFMYLFFADLCDVMVLVLLGFLAFGWNTRYKQHRDQEIYFPLAAMGGFMSVIITLITKINDGNMDKYHMHDSIPTYILMVLKIATFFIFLAGIVRSLRKKSSNMDLPRFFQFLGILGSFYFLELIILYLGVGLIDRCERQVWMLLAFEWGRNAVLCIFTGAFCWKKSPYRKVTLVNKSFMESDSKYL